MRMTVELKLTKIVPPEPVVEQEKNQQSLKIAEVNNDDDAIQTTVPDFPLDAQIPTAIEPIISKQFSEKELILAERQAGA
jgi:hypothetical protein